MPMPTPAPPPDANQTRRGLVSTIAQTFAGNKTFAGTLTALLGLTVAGGLYVDSSDVIIDNGSLQASSATIVGQLTAGDAEFGNALVNASLQVDGNLRLADGTILNDASDLGSTIDTSAFVGASKGYAPTATTRALWRLDESSGTATAADEKGAYPLSTVTGTPTVADGRFGMARVLTGTQVLSGPADAASITKAKAGVWTWGGWLYPTAKSGATFDVIAALGDGTTTTVLYVLYRNADGCIYIGSSISGNTTTSACTAVPLSQWTHVAWTCSAGPTMNCWQYINGVSSGTSIGLAASTSTVASPKWHLGGGHTGGSFSTFRGRLDEVFFEDKVLSAAEVSAVYALGNVTLAGPLAFNDGTAQTTAWTGSDSTKLPLVGGGTLSGAGTPLRVNSNDTSGNSYSMIVDAASGSLGVPNIGFFKSGTALGSVGAFDSESNGLVNGTYVSALAGKDIGFRTNGNTLAMKISSAGKVKIGGGGTITEVFEVAGNVKATGTLIANSSVSNQVGLRITGGTLSRSISFDPTDAWVLKWDGAGLVWPGYFNPSGDVAAGGNLKTAGFLQFTGPGASKPTCNDVQRGKLWFTQGATGVADTIEVCRKNASDAYVWVAF